MKGAPYCAFGPACPDVPTGPAPWARVQGRASSLNGPARNAAICSSVRASYQ